MDPFILAAAFAVAVNITTLSETVYGWFNDEPVQCYTKVNEDPEQWRYEDCLDDPDQDG